MYCLFYIENLDEWWGGRGVAEEGVIPATHVKDEWWGGGVAKEEVITETHVKDEWGASASPRRR